VTVGAGTGTTLYVNGMFRADNGYKIIRIPSGNGATNNIRWYLLATLPTSSYRTLLFKVLAANSFSPSGGQSTIHFQVTNWTTNIPIISHWIDKEVSQSV
jgi:hypothetical protein